MPDEIKGVKDAEVTPTSETAAESEQNTSSGSVERRPTQEGGVNTQAVKTYTEEDLNKIIHERTKSYSEKIKQYEEMLRKYKEKYEKEEVSQKAEPQDDLSEEDKRFLEYLNKKIIPRLNLGFKPEQTQFLEYVRMREEAENNRFMTNGENTIKELAKELKIPDNKIEILKETIASIILNDDGLKTKFILRDPSVFKDAFDVFKNTFNGLATNTAKEEVKKVVQTKTSMANVKPPVTQGIGAPLTEKKKLSDEELIEAAFKRLTSQ